MKKPFEKYIPLINQCSSIADVIQELKYINQISKDTSFENIFAFNNTYLIITEIVKAKMDTGYFDDDKRMEKFDIIFAQYYFDALHSYLEGATCPSSWRVLFDAAKSNTSMQWQYMALGVNAHVNNDLALALYDADFGSQYKNDYLKVNTIIFKTIKQVVESFTEMNPIINQIKNNSVQLYSPILYLLIKNWRLNAWNNFEKLKQGTITKNQIENKSLNLATLINAK